jgi:hypothetical protein
MEYTFEHITLVDQLAQGYTEIVLMQILALYITWFAFFTRIFVTL